MILKKEIPEKYKISTFDREINPGELVNYDSYLIKNSNISKPDQVVVFENFSEMLRCVDTNISTSAGGLGIWEDRNSWIEKEISVELQDDNHKRNAWRFGEFKTHKTATEALRRGEALQLDINSVSKVTDDIYSKHPELLQLKKSATKIKRKRTFSEDGADLNIDKYMSGEVEYWSKMSRRPTKRSFRINYNISLMVDVSPEAFIMKTLLICAFADILESTGISTEIWFSTCSSDVTGDTNTFGVFFNIKTGDERLDISKLIVAGSSTLFRYYNFALRANIARGYCGLGFGRSLEQVAIHVIDCMDFDIYLSSNGTPEQLIGMFVEKFKTL